MFILDTHTLLWILFEKDSLSMHAHETITKSL